MALNAERAAEEERGMVRWLRPEYQDPEGATHWQQELLPEVERAVGGQSNTAKTATKVKKQPWPKTLPERVRALRTVLQEEGEPRTAGEIAKRFRRARVANVSELLETLVDLGQARRHGEGYVK